MLIWTPPSCCLMLLEKYTCFVCFVLFFFSSFAMPFEYNNKSANLAMNTLENLYILHTQCHIHAHTHSPARTIHFVGLTSHAHGRRPRERERKQSSNATSDRTRRNEWLSESARDEESETSQNIESNKNNSATRKSEANTVRMKQNTNGACVRLYFVYPLELCSLCVCVCVCMAVAYVCCVHLYVCCANLVLQPYCSLGFSVFRRMLFLSFRSHRVVKNKMAFCNLFLLIRVIHSNNQIN